MDEYTDEDLLAAYAGGDEDVFSLLVKRHLNGVYSFVYRLVGSQSAAEDITQEIFLKVWKNIKSYNPNTSKFKTWMLHIARNASIDFLRKRKNIPLSQFEDEQGYNSVADSIADENKLPHELFADVEDVQILEKAIAELSPKQREILTLHYTNHLTFEEIADTLKEPPNSPTLVAILFSLRKIQVRQSVAEGRADFFTWVKDIVWVKNFLYFQK